MADDLWSRDATDQGETTAGWLGWFAMDLDGTLSSDPGTEELFAISVLSSVRQGGSTRFFRPSSGQSWSSATCGTVPSGYRIARNCNPT